MIRRCKGFDRHIPAINSFSMKAYEIIGFDQVSGTAEDFPIDHRIFNAAVTCSSLIALFYTIKSFLTPGVSLGLRLIILGVLSLYALIYYISRFKKVRSTWLRSGYLFLTYSGLMYSWTTTGGIVGITPYYLILTYMIYLTVFRLRYHILLSAAIFGTVIGLGIYQYFYPAVFGGAVVVPPESISNQLSAVLITMFFSLGMVNYLKLNYSIEKRKVLTANEELAKSEKEALKAKEEALRAEEEALRASQVKAEFLSTMSHEIRTPMNAVIGMTHLLIQEDPKPGQLENLNILKFSAEGLLALINDILDFSKIEAGKIAFEKVDFSLTDLVRSVREALAVKARDKGIELKILLDSDLPKVVKADPTRLTQILNNLVGNAVKFTKEGTVTIQLSRKSSSGSQAEIEFKIIDTGIGIPLEQQDKIFEKFSQASTSTTREFGGTGLGLSITKRLLELQNSSITLESEPGKGTTFSFTLDLEIATAKVENNLINFDREMFSSLKGLRVLLADDNKTNILIAKKFLKKWDIEVVDVRNGLDAVNEVRDNNYDVVLMDLQMPIMDGAEATRRIRALADDFKSKIPIIALTASAMLEEQENMYSAGMTDFVSKPFNPSDLYKKIVRYSELREKAA